MEIPKNLLQKVLWPPKAVLRGQRQSPCAPPHKWGRGPMGVTPRPRVSDLFNPCLVLKIFGDSQEPFCKKVLEPPEAVLRGQGRSPCAPPHKWGRGPMGVSTRQRVSDLLAPCFVLKIFGDSKEPFYKKVLWWVKGNALALSSSQSCSFLLSFTRTALPSERAMVLGATRWILGPMPSMDRMAPLSDFSRA